MAQKLIKLPPISEEKMEDLLSAISFTEREYEKVSGFKSPNFRRSLRGLSKKMWAVKRKARKL